MRYFILSFILLSLLSSFTYGNITNLKVDSTGYELLRISDKITKLNLEVHDLFWTKNNLAVYLSAKIRLSKDIPENVTPQILILNISHYLNKNPDQLHLNAYDLIDEICRKVYYKKRNKEKIPLHKRN